MSAGTVPSTRVYPLLGLSPRFKVQHLVSVGVSPASAPEGNSGVAQRTVTVRVAPAYPTAFPIDVRLGGTAEAGPAKDYVIGGGVARRVRLLHRHPRRRRWGFPGLPARRPNTIVDDDRNVVSVRLDAASAAEGDSGHRDVRVTLPGRGEAPGPKRGGHATSRCASPARIPGATAVSRTGDVRP